MSLKVDQTAPDFKLHNQNNDIIELSKLKKDIILFFYPKDNTPGCTIEAKDFSSSVTKLNKLGYLVFGISKDSTKKHQNFIESQKLLIDLLSDEGSNTCEDYGVWKEKNMYGKKYFGIERSTFIIDKKRKIIKIWNKVKVKDHVNEIIAFLEEN